MDTLFIQKIHTQSFDPSVGGIGRGRRELAVRFRESTYINNA